MHCHGKIHSGQEKTCGNAQGVSLCDDLKLRRQLGRQQTWNAGGYLDDGNAEDQMDKCRVEIMTRIALISVYPVSVVRHYVGRGFEASNSDAIAADSLVTLMPDSVIYDSEGEKQRPTAGYPANFWF